jgi:hypothetical protein
MTKTADVWHHATLRWKWNWKFSTLKKSKFIELNEFWIPENESFPCRIVLCIELQTYLLRWRNTKLPWIEFNNYTQSLSYFSALLMMWLQSKHQPVSPINFIFFMRNCWHFGTHNMLSWSFCKFFSLCLAFRGPLFFILLIEIVKIGKNLLTKTFFFWRYSMTTHHFD